ncbi:Metallo-beta-lactamase superfamily hydrolase [Methanosarcina horonobensis HB-1 = JCM 15518]|uniref:Metallo-beta-lactamase superfamily hydrolase n=1 Tax=Methanosarcina horonobensis HB-1 = JCM 15518 TaxID=1434110 RepID=A0A0E3SDD0_9EURY|nr:MBL fold metallo-hydrolase [Methanosarcina horonobensis]AKB78112.1 Metallo-beta-lactamase superfamily hydrolase [Methanosarcina horonobensis HB-1 = JCM 15518]
MKIFNVGYKSSNYYLIDADQYCLAIDIGWPGTINDYGRQLRPAGKRVQEINYLIVTHFHVDHAGLVQELKDKGVKFILFDMQIQSIAQMEAVIQKKMSYKPINLEDNIIITLSESRKVLQSIGLSGEVIHTPGHSGDSISVFLDSGDAFIGDLRPENQIMEDDIVSKNSWLKLKELGAKRVNPGHGHSFEV